MLHTGMQNVFGFSFLLAVIRILKFSKLPASERKQNPLFCY
jgi:hypothetical protein